MSTNSNSTELTILTQAPQMAARAFDEPRSTLGDNRDRLRRKLAVVDSLLRHLCLDIPRPYSDARPADAIVAAFARDLRERHWPWPAVPRLYHDPRFLETSAERASLHAKCMIIDRHVALVTSANFTDAAQWKNIEAGVEIRHRPTVERLAD